MCIWDEDLTLPVLYRFLYPKSASFLPYHFATRIFPFGDVIIDLTLGQHQWTDDLALSMAVRIFDWPYTPACLWIFSIISCWIRSDTSAYNLHPTSGLAARSRHPGDKVVWQAWVSCSIGWWKWCQLWFLIIIGYFVRETEQANAVLIADRMIHSYSGWWVRILFVATGLLPNGIFHLLTRYQVSISLACFLFAGQVVY